MSKSLKHVRIEVEEPLGLIILNRPEKLNAMNTEMLESILNALDRLREDRAAKVIAITGEGRVFSAGIDLREVASAQTPDQAAKPFTLLASVFRQLLDYPKPIILGLNGDAYAGGAELVWAADLVAAVRGAKLVWTEPRWGLVAPALAVMGPLVIGLHRSAYLVLTGTPLTAEEAHQLGLISLLVDTVEELKAAMRTLAERLLENAPQAVLSTRKLMKLYLRPMLEHGLVELERLARTTTMIEAAKAFVEKRKPKYTW